jgi:hypothetical protein
MWLIPFALKEKLKILFKITVLLILLNLLPGLSERRPHQPHRQGALGQHHLGRDERQVLVHICVNITVLQIPLRAKRVYVGTIFVISNLKDEKFAVNVQSFLTLLTVPCRD